MATLIQSKQIEGIVTASVITGDFSVNSGSVNLQSASGVTGSFSGSFVGDGTGLTINYSQLQGKPTFTAGTGILITQVADTITITNTGGAGEDGVSDAASIAILNAYTASNDIVISGLNQTTASLQSQINALISATSSYLTTDNTGSDSQTLTIVGDQLTISGGNTITIPTGSSGGGTSDFTQLTNVPSGLVSSSEQILGGSDIVSGSVLRTLDGTTVLSASVTFEQFSASLASEFQNIQHTQIPQGTISSSQQISDLGFVTSSGELTLPSGLISSSQQLIDLGFSTTDNTGSDSQTLSIVGDQLTISSGNTITIPTGSGGGVSSWNDLTDIPSGLVSSSTQVVNLLDGENVSLGIISGSELYVSGNVVIGGNVTIGDASSDTISFGSDISSDILPSTDNTYDLGSLSSRFSEIHGTNIYGSINATNNVISSSQQIQDLGFVTSSEGADITSLNQFTQSAESRLSALESATGSYLTSETDSQTLSIVGDQLTISDGNTITIPTGSGGTATDISSLNQFTQSIQSQVDSLTAATSSYLTELPSGLVSGSVLRNLDGTGVVSGSVLRTLDGTGVLSGSVLTDLSTSLDSRISVLESQTDNTGSDTQTLSIVGNQITISDGNTITIPTGSDLPSGIISSSQQISDLGYVTSSLEAPFNGDRVVSNTLLGELYSQSFNAGTTGSLAEFITAVFFPTEAPTATFTNQTVKWNENLATDGTNLVSVSLTDTVDNSPYTLVLSGTDASSLLAVPTNSDSSSWEIRANGDLNGNTYSYNVTVGDSTNAERTYSNRSIVVDDVNIGTLSTNGTLYVIESATSGPIYLGTNGRGGSQGGVTVSYSPNYGSQVATNFSSSNPLIAINSTTGLLSVGSPISGSGNTDGSTITSNITYNDQYGNQGSGSVSVNVTTNFAPNQSATLITNNNTNQATGSTQVVRVTVSDTEGDSIPNGGLVWGDYNSTYFSASVSTPYLYLHSNNTSIPAGVYPFTASFSDVHGFRTSSYSSSVTINQADNGTLGGDINNYIIESALSGSVLRDQTGFNAGNASQVTVSYSPSYGSPLVQSFTSSNPSIAISNTGHLTLAVDLSGSVTQSGATINSTIGWEDQYGNVDSRAINVTVFGNQSPAASFTDLGLNTETAVSGAHIGTLTITDTETNTPFSASIGGTDGGKFEIVPQNANSSSYYVYPTGSLTQGDYSIQFSIRDNYSETATLNETISVSAANDYGVIYVYTQNLGPAGSWAEATYKGIYGISVENGDTPPEVTSFTTAASMLSTLVNNDVIGDSTITFNSTYTMTLRDTIDGDTTLDSALASNGSISAAGTANILLLYPSGSDMEVPTSIQQTINGTVGGGVPYINVDNAGWGIQGARLNSITLDTPHLGYSEWFVLGRSGTNGIGTDFQYRIVDADGGSVPS